MQLQNSEIIDTVVGVIGGLFLIGFTWALGLSLYAIGCVIKNVLTLKK